MNRTPVEGDSEEYTPIGIYVKLISSGYRFFHNGSYLEVHTVVDAVSLFCKNKKRTEISMIEMIKKTVLITDLDNTLFDWVEIWFQSFSAMLKSISEISEINEDQLKREIKAIHQAHGTSEYAFLIEEIPSLQQRFPQHDLVELFAPSIEAYRTARTKWLKLYPTVKDTLSKIQASGSLVVGYTESMAFYSNYRVRKLGLDGLLNIIYSPPDHELPRGMTPEQLRKYPAQQYRFETTLHRHTPLGELKPNAGILNSIVSEIGADHADCVYLGDSLFKDIAMANDANITSVLAQYGVAQNRPEYQLLREVTHWTNADVEREKEVARREDISAKFVLQFSFGELLSIFNFEKFNAQ